jgi:hypothetical protein
MTIPFDDLVYILKNTNLTVLECGIPVEKVELHVLNLIRLYSKSSSLNSEEIETLLVIVNFSEISKSDAYETLSLKVKLRKFSETY